MLNSTGTHKWKKRPRVVLPHPPVVVARPNEAARMRSPVMVVKRRRLERWPLPILLLPPVVLSVVVVEMVVEGETPLSPLPLVVIG